MKEIDISQVRKPLTVGNKSKTNLDFLNKEISFGNSFSDKKKEAFYSELHILLSSGVDLKTALEIIVDQEEKNSCKHVFIQIKDCVISGSSFSNAIKETNKFSAYEYHSLKIGEESGRLNEILQELTNFFSRKVHQKRQMVGAFSYPMMVLLVAFGAIFFMLRFVVPMFKDVFRTFKSELPYITQKIIKASEFFANYSVIMFFIIISIIIFFYLQRKMTWFRRFFSGIILRIPLIGSMTEKIFLARFCQAMKLLTGSKTPLVKSLELVEKMIDFYPIEVSLSTIRKDVLTGSSLHEALSKHSIYNRRLVSLVKVAEEVNKIDTVFDRLAKQYTDEVEHQSGIMSKMIEPIMMIVLGVIVATILIAMYLPLFQLSSGMR